MSLRGSLATSEDTRQTLSRDLDATRSQLISAQRELNSVHENSHQQSDVMSRTATTLTALADQLNKVVAAGGKSESRMTSNPDVTD